MKEKKRKIWDTGKREMREKERECERSVTRGVL